MDETTADPLTVAYHGPRRMPGCRGEGPRDAGLLVKLDQGLAVNASPLIKEPAV
jgi:hypothetical protein